MTDRDPIQTAIDQLSAYGLVVDAFTADGKLHRVKTDSDKGSKKSGWYVAHEFTLKSGRMVISGRYGNWKVSDEPQAFEFDAKFTDEEKAAFRAQQQQQRDQAAKEKKDRQQQAAERATKAWAGLPTDGASDYLARKKIHGFGCRYSRGSIAVPLYKNQKLTGLQWIDADGGKKFITGTEKQGAYFAIETVVEFVGWMVLCEGYATGCSLAMALPGVRVLVCFDAGNLETVASDMVAAGYKVRIAADNDHLKERNKGLEVARHLAQRYPDNVRCYWPEFPPGATGTDFNDLHVARGLPAVRSTFERSEPQAFPDGIGSADPLPDYADFAPPEAALAGEPVPDSAWRDRLKRGRSDKDGNPGPVLAWVSNIELIFEHDPAFSGALKYCEFSYRIIKSRELFDGVNAGEWIDSDTSATIGWLGRRYGFEPGDKVISHALVTVARRNAFHPVREYLDGLTWDGTERLSSWLMDVYEPALAERDADIDPADYPADTPAYLALAGKKFLIGAVARIYHPGCKMDNVLILEGRQGLRKSTSVKTLFGEWFDDSPIPLGEKDSYQNIQGIWCHELAELDSFNKAESTTAKNFFGQTRDRYRPSYGHRAEDFPRQTVFVGTTNQDEYLKDYSGNRRYWPVKCRTVNLDLLEQQREQLLAEAVHCYQSGLDAYQQTGTNSEPWWVEGEAERVLFEAEQGQRFQGDAWEFYIQRYINSADCGEYTTAAELLTNAIEKDPGQQTRADQNRIAPIMQSLGWAKKKKRIVVGGSKKPVNCYIRPAAG